MDGLVGHAEGESFVVAALKDIECCGGEQVEVLDELEEAFVLFVDAEDFGGVAGAKFGEKDAALLAKLGDTTVQGNAMRAGLVIGKALKEKSFDFGRDGVLHALGFGVGFGPGETDDFGEKHFGELMAEHEMLGNFAAFGGEMDLAAAMDFDVAVAGHAFEGCSDGGRSDCELFGEAGADGNLVVLDHFPNGLEVIFLRNTGFIAAQRISDRVEPAS